MAETKTPTTMIGPYEVSAQRQEEWQIAENWTKFLYPFLFTNHATIEDDFSALRVADRAHRGTWVEQEFNPRELENMLPYVKQYLQLPTNHRRFELSGRCLHPEALFTFVTEKHVEGLDFRIRDIVLHVFFNGVACLAIEVEPVRINDHALTVEEVEWGNAQLASLIHGTPFTLTNPQDLTPEGDDVFSISTLCESQEQLTIRDLITSLLNSFYEDKETTITPMVDRFLPVYGAMLLRPHTESSIETLDEQFFEFAQHHLTILRKTFTPNNISTFSEIHLEDSTHHWMPYHNVIHSQALDGGYILAYDNGLRHFSGDHAPAMASFRTSYFYMMLIPYHQRLSILRYAMAAADAGLSPERGAELRKLREEIYDFTSRCYFSQASMSEERNHIYERWQQEFHVVRMYNELKEEVHDIDNYLADLERERENELRDRSLRRDSRNMQLFGFITLTFLPVSLLLYLIPAIPILSRWINFAHHPGRSIAIVAGMVAFVACLLSLMIRYLRRGRRVWEK